MKKGLFLFLAFMLLGFIAVTLILRGTSTAELSAVAINDIVMTAMQNDNQSDAISYITAQIQEEYESLNAAGEWRKLMLRSLIYAYLVIITLIGAAFYLYCEKAVLKPFRKLRKFAGDIASGNLDIPLEMDRSGSFGAFTESFDLMREELKRARENERAADRSKKELVASLSHDIKTPIASIKATVELMQTRAGSDKEQKQLGQIGTKAEQINTLITDMFHATLHELEKLSVTPAEIHSTLLPDMIISADYKNMVKTFEIPSCIIIADPVRLQQIFDNIIGNSYKYAATDIDVASNIDGDYLIIEISDSGPGASPDELPLLAKKFYRGKNATDKSGYGLGLYICSYLINNMSGEITCENGPVGFAVTLRLRLA